MCECTYAWEYIRSSARKNPDVQKPTNIYSRKFDSELAEELDRQHEAGTLVSKEAGLTAEMLMEAPREHTCGGRDA